MKILIIIRLSHLIFNFVNQIKEIKQLNGIENISFIISISEGLLEIVLFSILLYLI